MTLAKKANCEYSVRSCLGDLPTIPAYRIVDGKSKRHFSTFFDLFPVNL